MTEIFEIFRNKAEENRKLQRIEAENCNYEKCGVYRGRAEAYEDCIAILKEGME